MEALKEEEKESERARDTTENWSIDSKTFSLVTVAVTPGGHFGHSVLHGCVTGSCNMFHHDPLGDLSEPSFSFLESTLVMFASDECV